MKVEVVDRTDEYIILEVSGDGLPAKRTSVHIDAIVEGRTTLQEQKEKALVDGEKRLARLEVLKRELGE